MDKSDIETSKFLSYVLRHQPGSIGIALDSEGWVDISALIVAAASAGRQIGRQMIEQVVASSDKKRFALSADGQRIRAVQGHSTRSVEIHHAEKVPPEVLYHGTASRFLESIWRQGLLPGQRQHVHLSGDAQTALEVGQRHGRALVLEVAAGSMQRQGHKFHQAENGVWLVECVPPCFLKEAS